jgi:tetratricopeptide (TPR) repeat protein
MILRTLDAGNMQEAMRLIENGMSMAPQHPEFPHLAAQILLGLPRGDNKKAVELLERSVALAPGNPQYHVTLSKALMVCGDVENSLRAARKALRADAKFAPAYTSVGIALAKLKRPSEAVEAFKNASKLDPKNTESWLNLAVCHMELAEPAGLVEAVKKLEELAADPDPQLLHQLGNIYRGVGRFEAAQAYYRRALNKAPDDALVWFALADVLAQAGELLEAEPALEKAAQLGYRPASIRAEQIDIAIKRDDIATAKALLAHAIDAAGDNVSDLLRIARQCTLLGDFSAQEGCLNRVLEKDPKNVAAFAGLALAPGRTLDSGQAERLAEIAEDRTAEADTRSAIGFALGDFYRHEKAYARSMRWYHLGNRLKGFSFDKLSYAGWLNWVESNLTREFYAQRRDFGSQSRVPILIVGMPRSGTTLTEQIVSSHPMVHGAGELGTVSGLVAVAGEPGLDIRRDKENLLSLTGEQALRHAEAYLERSRSLVDANETFVTNKLPHNFQQLGLFGLLFPQAPIIHIKRDPRDNLLSIYAQDFGGFHDYAYDLKTLGMYYRLYERLMDHWREVIPNPIYELQYEDLVADLPGKTADLAQFVGVDLDERMLRFWEQERKVETASRWQVRQPLYTSSVGRWRAYAKHLKPLFEGLGV